MAMIKAYAELPFPSFSGRHEVWFVSSSAYARHDGQLWVRLVSAENPSLAWFAHVTDLEFEDAEYVPEADPNAVPPEEYIEEQVVEEPPPAPALVPDGACPHCGESFDESDTDYKNVNGVDLHAECAQPWWEEQNDVD